MCVAAVAWRAHPDWQLVAVANRDEFHARPSAPLARWDNGIIAGRDLEAGGTWLGLSEAGRFALVTNYRVFDSVRPGMVSRGGLVAGWLDGDWPKDAAAMNPFSLFLVDGTGLRLATNHPEPAEQVLPPGIHGLSNGPFVQPWAKVLTLNFALERWLASGSDTFDPLFAALGNADPLPGEGPDPRFSPVMIRNPVYGTRCSTVVAIDAQGLGTIIERSFDPAGDAVGEVAFDFVWP